MRSAGWKLGVTAALSSALFLGVVPIFGKLAINSGFSPLAVIAVRTTIAALLMLVLIAVRMRAFFFIYPVGLVGCLLAGLVNGLGSILYYTALSRLDAGVGHILYSFYPVFMAGWLLIDRHTITRLTAFRLLLTVPAIFLIIIPGHGAVDLPGALMMLGSAVLYALHMLINQRILYEAPAQTVTLYTLLAMAVTVDIAFLLGSRSLLPLAGAGFALWYPLFAMAAITFFSRLTLFLGIKHLGGLQTAILGLAEVLVTVLLARVWLGETLTNSQWVGCALLAASLLLFGLDSHSSRQPTTGWLSWLNPARLPPEIFPPQSPRRSAASPIPTHSRRRGHS